MASIPSRCSSRRVRVALCLVGVAALLPMTGVSAATPTRAWSPEEQVTAYGDDNSPG